MTVSIFFIVEGARLEAQAALLAATLRVQNRDRYALIAYTSPTGLAQMPTPLRDLLDRLGVDLRLMTPDLSLPQASTFESKGWRAPYPHGNKILAAASKRDSDWSLFLDTDMICTAPLDLAALQQPGRAVLVPEGVLTWGREIERWQRAYDHFGLPLPTERVRLTRGAKQISLPYFNAGMVMFPEAAQPGAPASFGPLWLETALDFDWHCAISDKRPWLDQITLPLTLKRFGYDYLAAPAEMNFSISSRAYDPAVRPKIIHYHRLRFLEPWAQTTEAFMALEDLAGPTLHARLLQQYGTAFNAALFAPEG